MKVYLAELIDVDSMTRVEFTDDVNMVVYCGDGLNDFNTIAETFNKRDERTSGGAPIRIDPKDNWELREIGKALDSVKEASLITYNVASA